MFYKESVEVNAEFKILNLLPCRGRPSTICTILLYNLLAHQPHVVIILELYKASGVTLSEKIYL